MDGPFLIAEKDLKKLVSGDQHVVHVVERRGSLGFGMATGEILGCIEMVVGLFKLREGEKEKFCRKLRPKRSCCMEGSKR